MGLELAHVADPPDVVAAPIRLRVDPVQPLTGDLLAQLHGFEHRTIAKPASAHIVNLADPGVLIEVIEGIDQIVAVNVIPNLLPLVTEYGIWVARHRAPHEIGEDAVQLSPGMVGPCKTPTPKTGSLHPEVSAVLLNQHVGRDLGGAEQRVLRLVNGHRLVDTFSVAVAGLYLPASLLLDQRQLVRGIPIH